MWWDWVLFAGAWQISPGKQEEYRGLSFLRRVILAGEGPLNRAPLTPLLGLPEHSQTCPSYFRIEAVWLQSALEDKIGLSLFFPTPIISVFNFVSVFLIFSSAECLAYYKSLPEQTNWTIYVISSLTLETQTYGDVSKYTLDHHHVNRKFPGSW